jgi:hypothetical protein
MKTTCALLAAASALALAACTDTPTTATPLPTSAAAAGPEFCETVPSDPDAIERWNELCMPDR